MSLLKMQHIILVELLKNIPPWKQYNKVQSEIWDQTSMWRCTLVRKISWGYKEISLYQMPFLDVYLKCCGESFITKPRGWIYVRYMRLIPVKDDILNFYYTFITYRNS